MKIIDAINKINSLKPNSYNDTEKIDWLSTLDGMIKREIIDTHDGGESVSFSGYNSGTSTETELLVPAPYDDIYVYWLESKIDYYNGEYTKYNNSITRFNEAYSQYFNDYNRNNMPKQTKVKYF